MNEKTESSNMDSSQSRSPHLEPRTLPNRRLRILVADDDPVARRLQQGLLEPFGDCDVAVDGQEAIQRVVKALDDSRPYDLVCLDIIMPNVDGREALRNIREVERANEIQREQTATVMMMTSVEDPETAFASFNDECDAYLIKPVAKARLVAVLRQLGLTTPDAGQVQAGGHGGSTTSNAGGLQSAEPAGMGAEEYRTTKTV